MYEPLRVWEKTPQDPLYCPFYTQFLPPSVDQDNLSDTAKEDARQSQMFWWTVVISVGPEKPVWIPGLHYPSFQFLNESGCHSATRAPKGREMKLHVVSSGTLLYVLCRHLYCSGNFSFCVGHRQIMRSSKCEVYSFTSHKMDSLEDELVLPLSLLQFDLRNSHETMT